MTWFFDLRNASRNDRNRRFKCRDDGQDFGEIHRIWFWYSRCPAQAGHNPLGFRRPASALISLGLRSVTSTAVDALSSSSPGLSSFQRPPLPHPSFCLVAVQRYFALLSLPAIPEDPAVILSDNTVVGSVRAPAIRPANLAPQTCRCALIHCKQQALEIGDEFLGFPPAPGSVAPSLPCAWARAPRPSATWAALPLW